MKLYFFQVAPNPTKVRLYLAEKAEAGAQVDVEAVVVSLVEGAQKSAEHLARNPFGTLPVLELDDGTCIRESLAIIEYIEELHPKPAMIGSTPVERARARALERTVDLGVLVTIGRIVHATNSPLGLPPSPEVARQARPALDRTLAFVDDQLADGRPFLAGARPTIADCTLQAALQFGRFGQVEIAPRFEHVARWDRDYRERSCVQGVLTL